jgi:hypothetical protein
VEASKGPISRYNSLLVSLSKTWVRGFEEEKIAIAIASLLTFPAKGLVKIRGNSIP